MSPSPSSAHNYHPALNTTFKGVVHPYSTPDAEVHQYRGVKYASIPARFRRSVLKEEYLEVYDATSHGPECPQLVLPGGIEDVLAGITPDVIEQSGLDFPRVHNEFECLNLVISKPATAKAGDDLPVMVYIHGGGSMFGGNSSWISDGGLLVAESVRLRKPVIVVSVNYRLNVFGWVASELLKEDNSKAGDQGVGNYGAYDIHLAIKWTHKHIGPFGGSPSRIIIDGESAGGWNVDYQVSSLLPAYHYRAISQSGTANGSLVSEPQPLSEKGLILEKIMAAAKTSTIEELRQLSSGDLLAAWTQVWATNRASFLATPTIDGIFVDDKWRSKVSIVDGPNTAVLVGDCENEASLFTSLATHAPKPESPPPLSTLLEAVHPTVSETLALKILSTYSIHPSTSPSNMKIFLPILLADLCFSYPTKQTYAKLSSHPSVKKTYRYLFNQPNGFGGPCKGTANHALDLYYVFAPAKTFDSSDGKESDLAVKKTIQNHWISFANGEDLWDDAAFAYGGADGGKGVSAAEARELRGEEKWGVFDEMTDEQKMMFSVEATLYLNKF